MVKNEQERISELLQAWSELEPSRIKRDGDYINIKLSDLSGGIWLHNSRHKDLVIQAAIREACEAGGYGMKICISAHEKPVVYYDVSLYLFGRGKLATICGATNLTLAMLECWLAVMRLPTREELAEHIKAVGLEVKDDE